jgi:hypothetical protein
MTKPMLSEQDCKLLPAGICVVQYNWPFSGPAYYIAGSYKQPEKFMLSALSSGTTPVAIWHIKPKNP